MKGNRRLDELCRCIVNDMYCEAGENTIDVEHLCVSDIVRPDKDGAYRYEVSFRRNGSVSEVVLCQCPSNEEVPAYANAIKERLNEMLDDNYRQGNLMTSLREADSPLDEAFRDNQDLIDYLYG